MEYNKKEETGLSYQKVKKNEAGKKDDSQSDIKWLGYALGLL